MKQSTSDRFSILGTLFTVLVGFVGFVCWLTSMNNEVINIAKAQTEDHQDRVSKEDRVATQLEIMNTRLSTMEGEIKEISKAVK